jgi:alkylhydroperoxidase family enzyme
MVRVMDEAKVRRDWLQDKKLLVSVKEEEEGGVCIAEVTSRRINVRADCVSDDATALRLTNLAEQQIPDIARGRSRVSL